MAKVWRCDGPGCENTIPEDENLGWWWVEAPSGPRTYADMYVGEGCYCSPQCIVKAFTRMING